MVELRRRREGLERRRDGILSRTGNNDPGRRRSLRIGIGRIRRVESVVVRGDAHETVRMHLDEMRREEAELDF